MEGLDCSWRCWYEGGSWRLGGTGLLTWAWFSSSLDDELELEPELELELEMTDIASSLRISTSIFWARANAQAENCATLCLLLETTAPWS
jgi:hypothetical protein